MNENMIVLMESSLLISYYLSFYVGRKPFKFAKTTICMLLLRYNCIFYVFRTKHELLFSLNVILFMFMYLFATLVNQRLSTCKTIFLKKKRRKIEKR